MNPKQASELKYFSNYCNCGGYAYSMNGRNPKHPHMQWCAQFEEFEEWRSAMDKWESTTNPLWV